jgi:deazaflavin-dependent oxidoreductase (nitroreductase family)
VAAKLSKRLNRLGPHVFHLGAGRLLPHRFLLLAHRGRRSGVRRETVLEVLRYDAARDEAFVLCGFGRNAQWFRNIQAAPPLEVRIAGRTFAPQWRELPVDEAAAELARYESRHRLLRPIVRRTLARLSHQAYDGSAAARVRVVTELPVLAFRPRERDAA